MIAIGSLNTDLALDVACPGWRGKAHNIDSDVRGTVDVFAVREELVADYRSFTSASLRYVIRESGSTSTGDLRTVSSGRIRGSV
jgi:hypothetical protein